MKLSEVSKHLDNDIQTTIKNICGELIAQGTYRDVYELKGNKNYVVKIERDMSTGQFCNACEYRNWCDNRFWDYLSPWLCPCVRINETSQVLIQKRAKPIKSIEELPSHVPSLFSDLKMSNFGKIGNRVVILDYPWLRLFIPSRKMRKVDWTNRP